MKYAEFEELISSDRRSATNYLTYDIFKKIILFAKTKSIYYICNVNS